MSEVASVSIVGTDLNLLVALRALLEEANVTRAGERIQLGQPSMSAALAKLRRKFGDELLVRVGREFELTPLARQLLPQVQLTLPLVERALASESPFDPATSRRTFTICASDFAAVEVTDLLKDVLSRSPGLGVSLRPLPAQPTEAERDLLANEFVVAVPGIGIEAESAAFFVDHYVCLVDRANPALVDGRLSLEAFQALPQAVTDFGRAHLTPAERRLRELGIAREARVTVASFLALPKIIAGTDLVGIVPGRLARRFGPATGTVGVPTPFGEVELIERLWWHSSHEADPAHAWLRAELLSRSRGAMSAAREQSAAREHLQRA